jgi:hypothetical protein
VAMAGGQFAAQKAGWGVFDHLPMRLRSFADDPIRHTSVNPQIGELIGVGKFWALILWAVVEKHTHCQE